MDNTRIIAKVKIPQVRMSIQAEPLDHKTIEIPHQIVSEEKAADLFLYNIVEQSRSGEKFITVSEWEAIGGISFENRIQGTACSTFTVTDQHPVKFTAPLFQNRLDRRRNFLRRIVIFRWQTL